MAKSKGTGAGGRSPRIKVVKESPSGRNQRFKVGNRELSRGELVKEIEQGKHPDHHVRVTNGTKTPVSNPDKSASNNIED